MPNNNDQSTRLPTSQETLNLSLICDQCHKPFKWAKKASVTPKYCSGKCRRAHAKPHQGQLRTVKCDHCKTEFTVIGTINKKYCNEECRDNASSARFKGKKKKLKPTQNATSQVACLLERIQKHGGLQEFLISTIHLEIEQRRALAKIAETLPYDQHEECHRLINRCSPISQ